MIYSNKTLAKIGKEIVRHHPAIATAILQEFKKPVSYNLEKIPFYFAEYCTFIGGRPDQYRGPVYKSSITEVQKIFISAMINIYQDQYQFKKKLTETLDQHPSAICRMIGEARFRYDKDWGFKDRVNQAITFLNTIA